MTAEVERYSYRVMWSDEDKEYVGLCAEFPSLSYLDENSDKAMEGIVDIVREVIADMMTTSELLPNRFHKCHYRIYDGGDGQRIKIMETQLV